jgi:hypothetical protein
MKIRNIGAPNSIARYCANTSFGDHEYAVFEYVNGMPVVRAVGTQRHCEHYIGPGRMMVNVGSYRQQD